MTDQFQHVMVLTSIIVGLGITHLLAGVGAAVDRLSEAGSRFRPGWTHACWVSFVFIWLVSFWWWEFRLLYLVQSWTFGRYLFLILYAVVLFLLAVTLVPRSWDGIEDLDAYFLAKRKWFYSLLLFANVIDLGDSLLKGGWAYLIDTGPIAVGLLIANVPAVLLGLKSKRLRVHVVIATVFFLWQLASLFDTFPSLISNP